MKKILLFMMGVLALTLYGCTEVTPSIPTEPEEYICKDQPLSQGCYIPATDLDHISPIPEEYLISEVFDDERIGASPRNWLLYANQEYALNGVRAFIAEEDGGNRFVRMYSDGVRAPMYPQSAPTPTFIFTTKFNLDLDRKGVAYASIMMPSDETNNAVSFGVSTGAVNTISIVIGTDLKVSVKVGGPYFYYSGTGDGGDTYQTSLTLSMDQWHTFRFEWDASLNSVSAYVVEGVSETLIHQGAFHISNRVNALPNGQILTPNVFRVTMPRYMSGWAYLDNVIVERKGE